MACKLRRNKEVNKSHKSKENHRRPGILPFSSCQHIHGKQDKASYGQTQFTRNEKLEEEHELQSHLAIPFMAALAGISVNDNDKFYCKFTTIFLYQYLAFQRRVATLYYINRCREQSYTPTSRKHHFFVNSRIALVVINITSQRIFNAFQLSSPLIQVNYTQNLFLPIWEWGWHFCITPTRHSFRYIIERTINIFDEMIMISALYQTDTQS